MLNKQNITVTNRFGYAILVSVVGFLIAVGAYSYLGTFSRYIADDYCDATEFKGSSVLEGVIERYSEGAWRAAGRYASIFFIGLGELLGQNNIQIIVTSMIPLWTLGLIWLIHETQKIMNLNWNEVFDLYFGLMIAFFSLLLAPNIFQTIYWRASMMNHFAPLVFGVFLIAFLIRLARQSEKRKFSPFLYAFILFVSFLFAGFSEPPTTTMLTILPIIMVVLWFSASPNTRLRKVALFSLSFVGVIIGFMVMFFSPAVSNVINEKNPNLGLVFLNSFNYAFLFMWDTVQSLMLPLGLSFLLPFLSVWFLRQTSSSQLSITNRRHWWLILLLPLLVWLLIAAGFSPSAFGQGFPVERMRFLALVLMVAALVVGGIWLGMVFPEFKPNRKVGIWSSLLIFVLISIVYPLRATNNLLRTLLPEYRERAELWDTRNEYIIQKIDEGENDLVVRGLSGFNGVKELDSNPAHWINVCAANFYGVSTIQAVSMEDEKSHGGVK